MTNPVKTALVAAGLAVLLAPAPAARQAEVLTNQSIVQMVVGKVSKNLILDKIRTTNTAFDVTANALVALHHSKVSDDVIEAMIRAPTKVESKEVLTNESVVLMVNGDLSKKLMLLKIQMTKSKFDLTTSGLISLTQNKVSADVQKAMMNAAAASKK